MRGTRCGIHANTEVSFVSSEKGGAKGFDRALDNNILEHGATVFRGRQGSRSLIRRSNGGKQEEGAKKYGTKVRTHFMARVHTLRRAVESGRAHAQRRKMLALGAVLAIGLAVALALLLAGCGGGSSSSQDPPAAAATPAATVTTLSATDVGNIVQAAASAVAPTTMVIAVADRAGNVLAVYRKPNAPATVVGNFGAQVNANDVAVGLARTGAFFSNDQAPLTSRTVRFISGIHFPPGVSDAPNADLYGIENTNRGCTLSTTLEGAGLKPSMSINGGYGSGIITGKADLNDSDPNAVNPGGVPIYSGTTLVGGVGVTGVPGNVAEYAAVVGASSKGFSVIPMPLPSPGEVFLGGVALPSVDQTTAPAGVGTGTFTGNYIVLPMAGLPAPEGDLVPAVAGPVGGLAASDVETILNNAEATANTTRAAIRLPPGVKAKMVIAVADLDGTIIGLRRMTDATVFSVDVAASKARNMTYFNSSARLAADLNQVPMGTAVTNRTISFGAQPLFPPGINGSAAGPFFNLYSMDTANPCTQGFQTGAANANKSGIVFFPGSAGLFRNGVLVGGLGVSGDGVSQDDYVTSGGTAGFEAPLAIRADQIFIEGVRLPYFKFPRDPTN
jgi:uncharacterized protein GlcG (DUF336 family)